MQFKDANRFVSFLAKAERIAIVTHQNPDGDAFGSGGALFHYVKGLGKKAALVLPDNPPRTLDFILEGVDVVSADEIDSCDLLLCTDFNVLSRAGSLEQKIRGCKAPKVLFDHHPEPDTEDFDLVFSAPELSSASEVVFWVLKGMEGDIAKAGIMACNALMCGMTTDTNNFSNSVSSDTLVMAGELLKAGVDRDDIIDRLYRSYRENRVRAHSYLLDKELRLCGNGIAYIVVRDSLWHEFGLEEGELDALVNVPLTINDVKISITLREDPANGWYRVSIRSKRGWSARNLAMEFFNGGGHENASGGRLRFPQDIPDADAVYAFMENLKI